MASLNWHLKVHSNDHNFVAIDIIILKEKSVVDEKIWRLCQINTHLYFETKEVYFNMKSC
jgi:hypothetical protein